MKCPLCGLEFDAKQLVSVCGSCPLISRCPLVRCPQCSYEWPAGQDTGDRHDILLNIPQGVPRKIISVCTIRIEHVKKIVALGILPGVSITVLRKSPAFLCRIGFAQISIDESIARVILVEKEDTKIRLV